MELANSRTLAGFDASLPLLGFARRMTGYKRANLILRDRGRLEAIAEAGVDRFVFCHNPLSAEGGTSASSPALAIAN